jgi:hypothetical protein
MTKPILKRTKIALLFVLALSFGCNPKKGPKQEEDSMKDTATTAVPTNAAEKIVYSIPSPLRAISLLKRAGSHYIDGLINSPEHVKSYVTNSEMSLNLGVYGADLAYTCLFDQTQASIKCMKASRQLAEAIGISNAFSSNNLIARFEGNLSNRDSLLGIISELYRESGNYLKENDNNSGAALMLAGGWIEGLYIASRSYEKNNKKDLAGRIAEQQLSLDNLISMLKDYKDQQGFKELIASLEDLRTAFLQSAVKFSEQAASADTAKHTISLNSEATYSLDDNQVKVVAKKIESLRAMVVKHN